MGHAPRAVLLTLLALSACGKSQDEKLFDQRRALCFDLAARHATMQDAIVTFGAQQYCSFSTPTLSIPRVTGTLAQPADGSLDGCPFVGGVLTQPLVEEYFEWHAVDDSLCSGGACSYYCKLYYASPVPAGNVPFCGARFESRSIPLCFL